MEVRDGYKQTEIGMIPEDWESVEFGDIATIRNVKVVSSLTPAGTQCVELESISQGSGRLLGSVEATGSSSKYSFKKGDVLFGRLRAYLRKYWLASFDGICSTEIWPLIPRDTRLCAGFLHLLVQTNRFVDTAGVAYGTHMPRSDWSVLRKFAVQLPSASEQTVIATALSDADALIQSLEKLIAKKRNIKQGAMQELLKPKEDWGIITFGNAFEFLSTASYSRSVLNEKSETGYVHYGDIHTKWTNFLDFRKDNLPSIDSSKAKAYPFLKEGDLIMADASEDYEGVGKSVEVKNLGPRKAISGLHTLLLRDKNGIFVNGFRGYISSCITVKKQLDRLATGLKVYGISKNNLKVVEMPLPPHAEQTRIATILSDMDAEIAALETKLAKYRQIKQGMMQELLTGRIRLV